MSSTPRPRTAQRRAKVAVSAHWLADLLNLPEGVDPVHVYVDQATQHVFLVVESDAFPEVLPCCEPPFVRVSREVAVIEVEGQRYERVVNEETAVGMALQLEGDQLLGGS
jgi:hypothetical protein